MKTMTAAEKVAAYDKNMLIHKRNSVKRQLLINKAIEAKITVSEAEIDAELKRRG